MFKMHEAHLLHTSNVPQSKKDYILQKHADQGSDGKETMIFPRIAHNCRCPDICKYEWKIFRPDSGNFSVAVISSCHEYLVLELVDRHDNLVQGAHLVQLCLIDEKLLTQYGPVRCRDDVNSILVPHQACSWCMQQPESYNQACNNPECVARTPHLLLQNDEEEGVQITCEVINGRLVLDRLYIGNSCKSEKRKQLTPRILRLMAIMDLEDCFQTAITKPFRVPTNRSKTQRDRNLKQTISKLTGIPPRKMRNRKLSQDEPPAKRRAVLVSSLGKGQMVGFGDEGGTAFEGEGFHGGAKPPFQHNREVFDRNSFVLGKPRMRILPPLPLSTTSLLTSRHVFSPLNGGPPGGISGGPCTSSLLNLGYPKQRKFPSDPLPQSQGRRQLMPGGWGQGQEQNQGNMFPPKISQIDQNELNQMMPQFSNQQDEILDAIQRRKIFEKQQPSEPYAKQLWHMEQKRFEFPPNVKFGSNKGHAEEMYGGPFQGDPRGRDQQKNFHPYRGYKSAPLESISRYPPPFGTNPNTFFPGNRFIERETNNNIMMSSSPSNLKLPNLQDPSVQKEHVIQVKPEQKQISVKGYLRVLNEPAMGSEEEMDKLQDIVECYSKKIPAIDKIGEELMFKPNLAQPTIQFLVMSSSEGQDFAQILNKVLTTLQGAKI